MLDSTQCMCINAWLYIYIFLRLLPAFFPLQFICKYMYMPAREYLVIFFGLLHACERIFQDLGFSWFSLFVIVLIRSPAVTGTSILGIKYDGGVMLAADTLGTFSKFCAHENPYHRVIHCLVCSNGLGWSHVFVRCVVVVWSGSRVPCCLSRWIKVDIWQFNSCIVESNFSKHTELVSWN